MPPLDVLTIPKEIAFARAAEVRGAIGSHSTSTVDKPWDGAANEKRLKSGKDKAYYSKMYAWVNPEGDATVKASYKFPHHEVDADGKPGAANLRGCSAVIAVLNGGRGGTKIPDADRKGVWSHVAKHIRDAGKEPPKLRAFLPEIERRFFPLTDVELRVSEEDGSRHVTGHLAVFNKLSEMIWGRREKILPGAFKEAIPTSDVRMLQNHDVNRVLGRNTSGTLKLWEDKRGLAFDDELPDTTYARDLAVVMDRGDVTQCSFAFTVSDAHTEVKDEVLIRVIEKVKRLYDGSIVTYPAYPDTDARVREARQLACQMGVAMTERELWELARRMRELVPDGDGQEPEPPKEDGSERTQVGRLGLLRRRLELELAIH